MGSDTFHEAHLLQLGRPWEAGPVPGANSASAEITILILLWHLLSTRKHSQHFKYNNFFNLHNK